MHEKAPAATAIASGAHSFVHSLAKRTEPNECNPTGTCFHLGISRAREISCGYPPTRQDYRAPLSPIDSNGARCVPRERNRRKGDAVMKRLSLTVKILHVVPPANKTVIGRDAWALQELISAGDRGCTPIENPGPRWSGYIHNLRQMGFRIDTIREPHAGEFPGQHARYVLRSRVVIVNDADQRLAAAHG